MCRLVRAVSVPHCSSCSSQSVAVTYRTGSTLDSALHPYCVLILRRVSRRQLDSCSDRSAFRLRTNPQRSQ